MSHRFRYPRGHRAPTLAAFLLIAKVMKVMLFHRETSQCEVHYSVRCTSNVHRQLFWAPNAGGRTESENVLASSALHNLHETLQTSSSVQISSCRSMAAKAQSSR